MVASERLERVVAALGIERISPVGTVVAIVGILGASWMVANILYGIIVVLAALVFGFVLRAATAPRVGEGTEAELSQVESLGIDVPRYSEALEACSATLDEEVTSSRAVVGWSHFLGPITPGVRRVSPIATAYGLRTRLLMPNVELGSVREATASIWKMQNDDGGWSSKTQGGTSRPETTAMVAVALFEGRSLSAKKRTKTLSALRELAGSSTDKGLERTVVLASVIEAVQASGDAVDWVVPLLADKLREAASRGKTGVSWGQDALAEPSVHHSARAICALSALSPRSDYRMPGLSSDLSRARAWLANRILEDPDVLRSEVEVIRRPGPGEQDELLELRHFTAAWVVTA